MLELAVSTTQIGGKAQSASELHIRNVFKLALKQEQTWKATQDSPALTPPQGAIIVDADDMDSLGL